jgi:3-phenylpropionate/trans-cinnamate dioxygenase ferredoxin reductase component
MLERIAIVGAGQAAVQAIDTLRRKGFTGGIELIGDEPGLPYQRPPLSKKYLAGQLEAERLLLRSADFYAEQAVSLRLGRRVLEVDRRAQRLRLDDGALVAYDGLLLATGCRPRSLPIPGSELPGVLALRTIDDALRIRAELAPGGRLVIVGGGYIGLEVAATYRELGAEVTVLEMADRAMIRVTSSEVSAFYQAEHARHGVRIACGERVSAFAADPSSGRVAAVICDDGSQHRAELVLVGVGAAPNDELARAAGLRCDNGIVVDEFCRSSDPNIYAAGDCTDHPSLHYGRRVRVESVDNAFEQGVCAGLGLLGTPTAHTKIPRFWSDQYDLKMIIVGESQGFDATVMRGDPVRRSFSVCYLREGELIAIDTVNSPRDQLVARKLIAARMRPDVDKLADPKTPLSDCV